jgi:carbon starvation protein
MTMLWIMLIGGVALAGGGWAYSRYISRRIGEDPARAMPAITRADGRDYVASPTPVVFAHHFAAIAGAGPIVGPVLAVVYGWAPALLWIVLGGVLVGAVHDYLAAFMSAREGGESVAVIARRVLGDGPFLAMVLFLVIMLTLVCAMFLNLSASALTSMVPMSQLRMAEPGMFRVHEASAHLTAAGQYDPQRTRVIIGGIASTSVIVITAFAPLMGWLYIKRRLSVRVCSIIAVAICAISVAVGLYWPVALEGMTWKLLLAGYVLLAAGTPVWMLLQSRDFINVHILYVGLGVLLVVLLIAGATGATMPGASQQVTLPMKSGQSVTVDRALPAFNVSQGELITGLPIWPMMFITIACGAVSGFHGLCAGGTTCKQLRNEPATRRVGYWAMLLESFVALCVVGVCMIGSDMESHLKIVYGAKFDWGAAGEASIYQAEANPVLAFAIAAGMLAHSAIGVPVVVGALAGMVMLEGFLVTTLDAAVRLMRYLLEELWRTLLGRYDVFAAPLKRLTDEANAAFSTGENAPAGSDGIPLAGGWSQSPPPAHPRATRGPVRWAMLFLRQYWVNSGLAVGLTLLFALTGGVNALWSIFATANQLLAGLVLALAALWLLSRRKKVWFALAPALFMLATTATSLWLLLKGYIRNPSANVTLLVADCVLLTLTAYLLVVGVVRAVGLVRLRRQERAQVAEAQV